MLIGLKSYNCEPSIVLKLFPHLWATILNSQYYLCSLKTMRANCALLFTMASFAKVVKRKPVRLKITSSKTITKVTKRGKNPMLLMSTLYKVRKSKMDEAPEPNRYITDIIILHKKRNKVEIEKYRSLSLSNSHNKLFMEI